ncbi:MAG: DUF2723 domain-containing protein [Chloroflexi bacterium]|nr:DUF2723 domain-containing protein [Chloroflexota bacterium]
MPRPVPTPAVGQGRLAGWGRIMASAFPPLAVAVVTILVIRPGLMPDVGFWDTAEFQTVLPILGTAHPTGYPTYVLVGFVANFLLAPLGEPAFRMNVLSLLTVALAAAATVRLVQRLTGRVAVAMATGLGVALTPYTWKLATHADPHTLHLALVAILFATLLRWEAGHRAATPAGDRWLVAAAVVFGLSVGNHSLTLLLALPIALYVLAVEPRILVRPRLLFTCGAALVGTVVAVYLELPLRAGPFRAPLVYASPDTWDGFWYVALAEQFRGSLHDPLGNLGAKLGDLVVLAQAQFGYLALLIPAGFVATVWRHWRYALLTGTAMLATVLFNASYTNADISRYYLGPILWAWTWLAVLAALLVEVLAGRSRNDARTDAAASSGGPDRGGEPSPRAAGAPVTPAAIIAAALAVALLVPTLTDVPARAKAADLSGDRAARTWLEAALTKVEPDAVIVSWWSTSTTLWYAQYVDHLRPDLLIVDDRTRLDRHYGEATDVIALFLGRRPVYVIRANDYDLGLVKALYDIQPLAAVPAPKIYRVIGRRSAGG